MAVELICPDDTLQKVLATLGHDKEGGLIRLAGLISEYPGDARLTFLSGSILAGLQRYDEALAGMQRAVETAPEFVLARFQLGFLQLTCAKAAEAQVTWVPLLALPSESPFRLFALGLGHLIRDEFAETIEVLRKGITLNTEHPLLNNDMQLIIDEVCRKLEAQKADDPSPSASQLLFERYAVHDTSAYKH